MTIAAEADKPLAIDDFMELLRKFGYALIRLERDADRQLKSGVLKKRNNESFATVYV